MEISDTKSKEVSPVNGLARPPSVYPEPTWTETPPVTREDWNDFSELNVSAHPNSLPAQSEASFEIMLEMLSEVISPDNVEQLSMLEKFNKEGLEFPEIIEWLIEYNKGAGITTAQFEFEQSDRSTSSEDELEHDSGIAGGDSSFGGIEPRSISQEAVFGVMSINEHGNTSIHSQDIAFPSDCTINGSKEVVQPTDNSQLVDPQRQVIPHSQRLDTSHQHPVPQYADFQRDHLQFVHADYLSGTTLQTTASQQAGHQTGVAGSGSITGVQQSQARRGASRPSLGVAAFPRGTRPNTRREQLWRSQSQGPYYRGTQKPKKVVRNCFLNEWLSMNRPDIPLPNSSGQGFLDQNRVFDNLPSQDQEAIDAYVVQKVEAEQVEARRKDLAKYRNVDAKTLKGNGASKNVSGRVTHNSANGTLLGRAIAPAPTGYNQQIHGGAHNNSFGGTSINPSNGPSQTYRPPTQAQPQWGHFNHHNPYGAIPAGQYGGQITPQGSSASSSPGGQGMAYPTPGVAYNQYGCPSSQQSHPMGMMQGGTSWPGYLASTSGSQLGYSAFPYAGPYAGGPQPNYPQAVFANHYSGPPLTMTSNAVAQHPLDLPSGARIQDTSSSMRSMPPSFIQEDQVEESGHSSTHRVSKRARRS